MKRTISYSLILPLVFVTASEVEAGHCRKGTKSERIRCLNSEVAYLTAKQQQMRRELSELRDAIPEMISQVVPVGTVMVWKSNSTEKPAGWEFCDGMDGRPNFNGLWLVGTDDPERVGEVINLNPLQLPVPFSTSGLATGQTYNWGERNEEQRTPEATGTDHYHTGTGTISVADRTMLAPPSMRVRFICKAR